MNYNNIINAKFGKKLQILKYIIDCKFENKAERKKSNKNQISGSLSNMIDCFHREEVEGPLI